MPLAATIRRLRVIGPGEPGFLLVTAMTLAGCGGNASSGAAVAPSAPTAATPAAPAFVASGDNWDFRASGREDGPIILGTGYKPGGRIAAMNGAFNASGDTVTAVLAVWGGCVNDVFARFTGKRSGLNLDMTSSGADAPPGMTIRVSGTLSPDLRSFSGSYVAEGGGCGTAPAVAMTGARAELDGIWSDENVTLALTLATVPNDVKGSFTLSGTAQFTGNSCFPNATLSNGARGRLVFPDVTSGSNVYLMEAEVTPDLKEMRYVYWLTNGSCPDHPGGTGTLVRR